jgi:hypothetical protein
MGVQCDPDSGPRRGPSDWKLLRSGVVDRRHGDGKRATVHSYRPHPAAGGRRHRPATGLVILRTTLSSRSSSHLRSTITRVKIPRRTSAFCWTLLPASSATLRAISASPEDAGSRSGASISPAGQRGRRNDTRVLDKDQLDRLDFFIVELKKRGIYSDLNLNVGRAYQGRRRRTGLSINRCGEGHDQYRRPYARAAAGIRAAVADASQSIHWIGVPQRAGDCDWSRS